MFSLLLVLFAWASITHSCSYLGVASTMDTFSLVDFSKVNDKSQLSLNFSLISFTNTVQQSVNSTKSLGLAIVLFLKVSLVHQACIYLIEYTIK